MGNPILNKQRSTSKDAPKRPEPMEPATEEYEYVGDEIPYRGSVDHGVHSKAEPAPPPGYEDDYVVEYEDEDEEKPVEPVPVRIVQSGRKEYRTFKVVRGSVTGANVQPILGRDDTRISARILNVTGSNPLYVGPSSNLQTYTGYPLTTDITYTGESPVYACADAATTVEYAIFVEHAVRED